MSPELVTRRLALVRGAGLTLVPKPKHRPQERRRVSYVLDIVTTDQYTYLECPGTTRITVQVSNAAAAIGFGQAPDHLTFRKGAATYPPSDEPFLPVIGGILRQCDEIRVKSYKPGTPANVKLVAT